MWYVIQTISGEEEIVQTLCERLLERDIYTDLFIPHCIQKQKQKRTKQTGQIRQNAPEVWREIKKPLFPGYLFIDTDAGQLERLQHWLPIIRSQSEGHNIKLVGTGGSIVPISRPEQDYLSEILDEEYVMAFSAGYIVDGKVVVTKGPLSGREDIIRHIDRHKRTASIEVNALEKKIPTKVGLEIIARLTEEDAVYATIRSGAFAGMTGRVAEHNERKREVTLLVEVFGRLTPVVMGEREVEFA